MTKQAGLEDRYQVIKRSNPEKNLDCIVLEFDDPIARVGIKAWSKEMRAQGYESVYEDVIERLKPYTGEPGKVYFFGCKDTGGHYCFDPEGGKSTGYNWPGPWNKKIDGTLPPQRDKTEFKCTVTHKEGWTALAFWDYTIDTRPGSNSAFFTRGEYDFEEMLQLAKHAWPRLFKDRFRDKLVQAQTA